MGESYKLIVYMISLHCKMMHKVRYDIQILINQTKRTIVKIITLTALKEKLTVARSVKVDRKHATDAKETTDDNEVIKNSTHMTRTWRSC